jgi:hypothetical protein
MWCFNISMYFVYMQHVNLEFAGQGPDQAYYGEANIGETGSSQHKNWHRKNESPTEIVLHCAKFSFHRRGCSDDKKYFIRQHCLYFILASLMYSDEKGIGNIFSLFGLGISTAGCTVEVM